MWLLRLRARIVQYWRYAAAVVAGIVALGVVRVLIKALEKKGIPSMPGTALKEAVNVAKTRMQDAQSAAKVEIAVARAKDAELKQELAAANKATGAVKRAKMLELGKKLGL